MLNSRTRRSTVVAAVVAAGLVLVACTSNSASAPKTSSASGAPASSGASGAPAGSGASGAATNGGTASFALASGSSPNYIFPFFDPAHNTGNNALFVSLMYRPLYWIGSPDGSARIDTARSLGGLPTWNAAGTSATIKLNPYTWSDGTQLSPKNVALYMGIDFSEKKDSAYYTPGYFPDNLVSVTYSDSADTVTFNLKTKVNPNWFLYNELSTVTPLPTSWDLTAAGTRGNCSSEVLKTQLTACPAVYKYLAGQAAKITSYASNPLWKTIDGPWSLTSFTPSGAIDFVPNAKYSGSDKPKLSKFSLLPFTSDSAEYNVLRSGSRINVGYLPPENASPAKPDGSPGDNPLSSSFNLVRNKGYQFGVLWVNQKSNGTAGKILNQLYIRQALESSIDQETWIKQAYRGLATRTNGPVPVTAPANFKSPDLANPVYPFSLTAAKKYLTDNGWSVPSSGTATCSRPGTSAGDCGVGIPGGASLKFNLVYSAGSSAESEVIQQWKSTLSQIGITVNLTTTTANAVVGQASGCDPSHAATCAWQMTSAGPTWTVAAYPSADQFFASSAPANFDRFTSSKGDALIAASISSTNPNALFDYENFYAKNLPMIWVPVTDLQDLEVSKKLGGVVPNPFGLINPESWYFTK